jgi:hypothetical protein
MSRPLAGYPQSEGGKIGSVLPISGPTSYTQVTPASPPTGGQSIKASQFGMKFFDHVEGGLSDDGQYIAFVSLNGSPGKATTATVLWTIAHTGAEVTGAVNLSARSVAFRAIGS